MAHHSYAIPAQIGYNERLTFRMVPVNKAIMSAAADWLLKEELCLDSEAAKVLLMPFIEEYMTKPFLYHDEINTILFSKMRHVASDLKTTASLLRNNFDEPDLRELKDAISPNLLLPPSKRRDVNMLSPKEKDAFLRDHIDLVISFYNTIAEYIRNIIKKYEAKGFRHMAITCPH